MRSQVEPILASAARTVTGQSSSTGLPVQYDEISVYVNVTAVSGTTPSMTVDYQTSPDGGTTWFTVSSSSAFTAAGQQRLSIANNSGVLARINYTITGTTPSFTFAVWIEGKAEA